MKQEMIRIVEELRDVRRVAFREEGEVRVLEALKDANSARFMSGLKVRECSRVMREVGCSARWFTETIELFSPDTLFEVRELILFGTVGSFVTQEKLNKNTLVVHSVCWDSVDYFIINVVKR